MTALIGTRRALFYNTPAIVAAAADIAFINAASARYTSASSGCTTTGFDSSGGNFAVIAVAYYFPTAGTLTISDNKSNTYTPLTLRQNGQAAEILYYCENASCGAGHTFSLSGSTAYGAISAMVFSGVKTSSAFDQENGASGSASSGACGGGMTPSENNCLVVVGTCLGDGGPASINGSFDLKTEINADPGNSVASGASCLIQTTAAAENPTVTFDSSTNWANAIASFKKA